MKNHLRAWLVTFGFGMKSKIDSADFIEQNSYEVGFAEFYKNKIKPSAASLEEMRMKHLKKIALRGRLTFLAWLVLPMLTLEKMFEMSKQPAVDATNIGVLFAFSFGFLLLLPMIVGAPVARFKREFEEELFKIIFEFFGEFKY